MPTYYYYPNSVFNTGSIMTTSGGDPVTPYFYDEYRLFGLLDNQSFQFNSTVDNPVIVETPDADGFLDGSPDTQRDQLASYESGTGGPVIGAEFEADYSYSLIDDTTGQTAGRMIFLKYSDVGTQSGQTGGFVFEPAPGFTGFDSTHTYTFGLGSDNTNIISDNEIAYGSLYGAGTPVCFAAGTLIETDMGPVRVEDLSTGDLVMTRDHGLQPLRWAGKRIMTATDLKLRTHLRPIRIRAHALGLNTPSTDLLVSPQHRILVRSEIARRMFDQDEVLVAAKHLCELDGIEVADEITQISYHHIMFDQHEVVIANGAESESLYAGPQALKSVSSESRNEILTLFPELAEMSEAPASARYLVSGRKGRKLASRHAQNTRPLVSPRLADQAIA